MLHFMGRPTSEYTVLLVFYLININSSLEVLKKTNVIYRNLETLLETLSLKKKRPISVNVRIT